MTKARFTEEFKDEAVKQVIERGYTVASLIPVNGTALIHYIKRMLIRLKKYCG